MDMLGLLDIPYWLLLTVVVLAAIYLYTTWPYSTWSRLGIPGPKPQYFHGNSKEVIKKTMLKAVDDWKTQYGRVFGLYFGRSPILVVSDLDILREVLVKEFNNFSDRFFVTGGTRPAVVDKGLFFVGGPAWKRIRTLMTPAFTSSKLKHMCHYIQRCSRILEEILVEKSRREEPIDVKAVFGAFTMDVIAGTAFGLETNSQTREDEPFVVNCRKFFGKLNSGGSGWVLRIVGVFPFLAPLVQTLGLTVFAEEEADFFLQSVYEMVDERKKASSDRKKRTDFLQLLVDAEADSDQVADSRDGDGEEKSYKRMTREEVAGQGFVILMAGYETTSTTLQFLTYNLALHQDVQQRVYEEIIDTIGDADPTYDNVGGLKYLDSVIHETLRLFPPVAMINRRARQTTRILGCDHPCWLWSRCPHPQYYARSRIL
ncbi:cytochrome P450 3A29-like [Pomacea canaliculata]|uniref:cytochrome P450 3A29-like n=1 Tax=Pomacea canaliculata TaxID=400727 RepID=UPI000D72FCAD|nr:cytochrome P450 3A29-like [Pomacea canaliculata]